MSTYEATVNVSVRQFPEKAGETPLFGEREASLSLQVVAKEGGLDESAWAIVYALEGAAEQARKVVERGSRKPTGEILLDKAKP